MRSNFSKEFFLLGINRYRIEESEIKTHLSKMLAHIDYMLYDIKAGYILDRKIYYSNNFNVPILREKLSKRLLDFANAKKYRDSKAINRVNKKPKKIYDNNRKSEKLF